MTWALVETLSVLLTAGIVYVGGLVLLYPDRYASLELTTLKVLVVFAIGGLVVAIPPLLHAGMELYYRLR